MKRPRILLVSNRSEVIGGGEVSLLLLIEGLLASGEVDPILAVPGSGEMEQRGSDLGVRVVRLPLPRVRFRPWRLFSGLRPAGRILREIEPDVVHANGSRAMLIAGRAAVRQGLRTVWHVRVEGSDVPDRWLAAHATRIITPSRTVAARFPAERVSTVPNPVRAPAPEETRGASDPLRRELGEPDGYLLLVAGRLTPEKGHGRVLEALGRVDPPKPWRLLVAGRDDPGFPNLRSRLESLARDLGIGERVRFLGFREDLYRIMAACDLLVHAPDYEGFGRVFVEAMGVGLPVVCTPVGGLTELNEATGFGRLAADSSPGALARAVEELLRDEPARTRMAEQGPRLAAERYSVDAHAAAVEQIYREILGEGS